MSADCVPLPAPGPPRTKTTPGAGDGGDAGSRTFAPSIPGSSMSDFRYDESQCAEIAEIAGATLNCSSWHLSFLPSGLDSAGPSAYSKAAAASVATPAERPASGPRRAARQAARHEHHRRPRATTDFDVAGLEVAVRRRGHLCQHWKREANGRWQGCSPVAGLKKKAKSGKSRLDGSTCSATRPRASVPRPIARRQPQRRATAARQQFRLAIIRPGLRRSLHKYARLCARLHGRRDGRRRTKHRRWVLAPTARTRFIASSPPQSLSQLSPVSSYATAACSASTIPCQSTSRPSTCAGRFDDGTDDLHASTSTITIRHCLNHTSGLLLLDGSATHHLTRREGMGPSNAVGGSKLRPRQ